MPVQSKHARIIGIETVKDPHDLDPRVICSILSEKMAKGLSFKYHNYFINAFCSSKAAIQTASGGLKTEAE